MHRAGSFPGAACFHLVRPHQRSDEDREGGGTRAKAAPLQAAGANTLL
jgi:hypothetical protein